MCYSLSPLSHNGSVCSLHLTLLLLYVLHKRASNVIDSAREAVLP